MANWKLERGATVGHIQHLLGSRSLVSAIFTPFKLRSFNFLVPLLIVVWIANPLGGQLSLRVVSKESNYTTIDTPFVYLDPMMQFDLRALGGVSPIYEQAVDTAFNTALLSPASSKNGTQDLFGNVQIPMLEYLKLNQTPDANGWYHLGHTNLTGKYLALEDALGVPGKIEPLYVSITGIPFKANLTGSTTTSTEIIQQSEYVQRLENIKHDLFGQDVVRTALQFDIESSYMYTNCSFEPLALTGYFSEANGTDVAKNNFPNTTVGIATIDRGFSIAYDGQHNYNSTSARRMGVESWLGIDHNETSMRGKLMGSISEAWCDVTTTYIEAQVFCNTETNCSVSAIRESLRPHRPSVLTVLDGISYLEAPIADDTPEEREENFQFYANDSASVFFSSFIKSTGTDFFSSTNLGPLESYFVDPVAPYKTSVSGKGAGSGQSDSQPLVDIGSALFSRRLTQLLNTYWLASIDPFTMVNGIDFWMLEDGDGLPPPNTPGKMYIEKMVLRCHTPFMAVLLVIAIGLFIIGLITAYLDGTRKGPDVLDQFVNSLRHNPYVHVEKLGNTMEDGQDMARRLRNTVVQMGDVQPDEHVGYVAIATPSQNQPVKPLDHRRHYV